MIEKEQLENGKVHRDNQNQIYWIYHFCNNFSSKVTQEKMLDMLVYVHIKSLILTQDEWFLTDGYNKDT
mgnify:CR=1 FL=1